MFGFLFLTAFGLRYAWRSFRNLSVSRSCWNDTSLSSSAGIGLAISGVLCALIAVGLPALSLIPGGPVWIGMPVVLGIIVEAANTWYWGPKVVRRRPRM